MRRLARWFPLLLLLLPSVHAGRTTVSISGDEFRINGVPTHAGRFWQGHKIQGLLLNARLVQGTFDDRNPETVPRWAYPDTGRWDPDRNTREFVEAMPAWRRHGLSAFTLNLQGGSPEGYSKEQPWHNSAFAADGSRDPATFERLNRILQRADDLGMVVILGLFYFGQDQRLADEAAVLRAVDQTVDWIHDRGWRHVLVEVNNECDIGYDHAILRPDRVHELIERVHRNRRDSVRLLVGTSFSGGTLPSTKVVKASDFLLLHGNGIQDPTKLSELIRNARKLDGYRRMPVVVNEDDHPGERLPDAHFTAALSQSAGWGFFDYRRKGEGASEGFQNPPVDWGVRSDRKKAFFSRLAEVTGSPVGGAEYVADPEERWWKGNVHTHTLWSDGDDFPEMVSLWYKDHGYHFLGLTEHNLFPEGQRWIPVKTNKTDVEALAKYRKAFGRRVEERRIGAQSQVRLKPLAEFRPLLEEPGRFLMIPSEEITGGHRTAPVHINGINLREPVEPKGGSNVLDVMQRVVDAVRIQRGKTGQPMFTHINHPNFGWGITAEDLMRLEGTPFFEVYNGHPSVHNLGDTNHAGMERVWDILLAWRLGEFHLPPMYGLAVDDSHAYHKTGRDKSNAGRGWIQVRATDLTPETLVEAMERGDFYSTSGVELADVRREGDRLRIRIQAAPGVTYRTRFIGTRRGFARESKPVTGPKIDPSRVTRRYDPAIGEILAEVAGTEAVYRFRGDELYVRAHVVSSRPMSNPVERGEPEQAWVQPVIP